MAPRKKRNSSPVTRPGFRKGVASARRGRTFPPEVPTGDEVRALIKAASGRAPTGIRNRALVAMMYRGGLRISETLDLYEKDIDRQAGTITVLHGKGDKRRVVGLDSGAMALLERWLDKRKALGLNGRHPVFSTLKGKPLWGTYVRRMLARLAERAQIEKPVRPHSLRHAHASEMAREGFSVPTISQQLGHASSAVTAKYLDHIAPHERIEAVKAREWKL